MKKTINNFLATCVLFSRIPVKRELEQDNFYHAVSFLPWLGLFIGILSVAVFFVLEQILPSNIALLIAFATSIVISGAIHEDGFADCCDALFLKHSPEKSLAIMKDSRLGTFAVVGLFLLLAIKSAALLSLDDLQAHQATALLLGLSMARLAPLWLMQLIPPMQSTDTQSSKISQQVNTTPNIYLASIVLFILCAVLTSFITAALCAIAMLVLVHLCSNFFSERLGGYNGDCLGFTEQCAELVLYLVFAASLACS